MSAHTKLAAPPPDDDPADGPAVKPTHLTITHTATATTTGTDWGNWLYTGPDRIYTNVPVTATNGVIIHWHTNPGLGDGCWTPTTDTANTRPDNYRPEPAQPADTPEEG